MAERQGLRARIVQAGPIPLDAELECAPGRILALVGPSGSGKSTLLRCIAGIYRPAAGRIEVDGATWFDSAARIAVAAHDRPVGMVFQTYALFPHMTALGNVMAAMGGVPAAARRDRAQALLDKVHLAGLEDRRPAELSGGQQQRVAVARALARDPAVLLLDEPFSAVDQVTRRKLHLELAELRRSLAMPVVLVTHDLDEAALLADRMTVLHRGRTLQSGTPDELTNRPASAAVARLVDMRNVFAGRIAEQSPTENRTVVAWGPHRLETQHWPDFSVGDAVLWCAPTGAVVLHRRDRPSRGERENPIPGRIAEFTVLGHDAAIALAADGLNGAAIAFAVPTHVARRNGLARGVEAAVSVLAEGIHLIRPAE